MRLRDLAALLPDAASYAARQLLRRRRRPGPLAVSFLVTARCPLSCRHCFYHYAERSPQGELSTDEYRLLAGSLDGAGIGLFSGGEPFVRPDLGEIVTLLQQDGGLLICLIATNGQLTSSLLEQTEQILRRRPRRPLVLAFSLDGRREEHDRIRGAGTFDRAVRSWRECQRLGRHHDNLILTITSVLSSDNQHALAGFARWAWAELQPESLTVLLIRQTPRAGALLKQVRPELYRKAQQEALRPLLQRSRLPWLRAPQLAGLATAAQGIHRTMLTGERSFRCYAGRHGAVIDPQGRLNACEVLSEAADLSDCGSLRAAGMDFATLWSSPAADRIRRVVGRHEACAACTHETMGYLPSLLFAGNRARLVRGATALGAWRRS